MEYRYNLNDVVKISQESSSASRGRFVVVLGLCENIYGKPVYKIAVDEGGDSFCPAFSKVDETDLHELGLLERLKIRRRFPSRNIPVNGVELVHETELL